MRTVKALGTVDMTKTELRVAVVGMTEIEGAELSLAKIEGTDLRLAEMKGAETLVITALAVSRNTIWPSSSHLE